VTDRTSHAPALRARPERRLIRPTGSHRHVDFVVTVPSAPPHEPAERPPLRLALVLDRSGSMAGEKLPTAKRAALAVVDRLDTRDQVAVVIFDSQVDVLQAAAPATPELKRRVRDALSTVEARAQTALHEGWLTGARAIAEDGDAPTPGRALARVFLLTDGLANVGVTDPERIASEAQGVREHAGIGTSTFGIGPDYNEALLGPMAVAGGGRFHHLRTPEEIARTFVGELGELFAVAARGVALGLEVAPSVAVEVVSAYHAAGADRLSIGIGDLAAGEERHVVVRFGFPPRTDRSEQIVRARLRWRAEGGEEVAPWQELRFAYADHAECDAEPRDPEVMRSVGVQHAERAKREAAALGRRGDTDGARRVVERVAARIAEYAGADAELGAALEELRAIGQEVAAAPPSPMYLKEMAYTSLRRSRGQRDLRGS
jgi:Ca-activated chloride channel family protein